MSSVAPRTNDKSSPDPRMLIRQRSKRLFGNADRLEVAHAVATSSGLVHAQELADELGISPPRVRTQLLSFVEAGVMVILPRDGLVQNYERIDEDPFWELVKTLVQRWTQFGARSAIRDGSADA